MGDAAPAPSPMPADDLGPAAGDAGRRHGGGLPRGRAPDAGQAAAGPHGGRDPWLDRGAAARARRCRAGDLVSGWPLRCLRCAAHRAGGWRGGRDGLQIRVRDQPAVARHAVRAPAPARRAADRPRGVPRDAGRPRGLRSSVAHAADGRGAGGPMMYLLILLYVMLVLLRPQDYPEWIARLSGPLLPGVLVLAAGFWLLPGGKSFAEPQYALLLMFLGAMMFSRAANGWFGGALLQWSAFAPVLLAFVLTANAVDSRARARVLMAVFVLCAAVLALHGVGQVRDGIGWTGVGLSQGTRIQYVGIFSDPNDLGMLFVMCVPMAMHLAGGGGQLRRLGWTAVAGLLLYGICLINSRGTMLALIVMVGVYVWFRWGLFRAMVMGAIAFAALRLVPSRMQDLSVGESSAFGRVEAWYD